MRFEGANLQLETPRLVLRLPQDEDFERYTQLMADEATAQFIGGHVERNEAWRRFLQLGGSWFFQSFGPFSVLEKSSKRWLGYAGPWYPQGWPCRELIYAFHPDSHAQGLAREAAMAAVDWTFSSLGWNAIHHFIDPGNTRSQRLAAHLGAQNQGPGQLPLPWQSVQFDVWRLGRCQWQGLAQGEKT